MTSSSVGETTFCKWKGNKRAAYSVGGDDSLRSQLFFAIPEMDLRGIRGTWWVNPGRGGSRNYKNQDDSWANCWIACYDVWKAAATHGHDFGNHTLHHLGAATIEEADHEIGETAAAIWQTNPRQRLQLFLEGGGTTWGISNGEIEKLLRKYDCVWGRGGGVEDPTWEVNPDLALLKKYVDATIQEGSWHLVGFHGIGPACEWGGPVDGASFTGFLDYLVEKRDVLWVGTHTEVHKYEQERKGAVVTSPVITRQEIRLDLTSDADPRLYNYPLTLRTMVGPGWERALVRQGSDANPVQVISEVAQYDCFPNKGEIRVQRI